MELLILFAVGLVIAFPVISVVALVRSGKGYRAIQEVADLRRDLDLARSELNLLRPRLLALESARTAAPAPPPPPEVAPASAEPVPVVALPEALVVAAPARQVAASAPEAAPVAAPVAAAAEVYAPAPTPSLEDTQEVVVPAFLRENLAPVAERAGTLLLETAAEALAGSAPEADAAKGVPAQGLPGSGTVPPSGAPAVPPAVPPVIPPVIPPTAPPAAAPVVPPVAVAPAGSTPAEVRPPEPAPVPLPARPRTPAPVPLPIPEPAPEPSRNLEDLLGGQLFLKAGVAIVVIGVVFAMGLVFQRMGPLGKVLMGLLAGTATLFGGRRLEVREGFAGFGRTLVAGAWGILYFVAYAAGFVEAAKVLPGPVWGVAALLLAGGGAVAYSLQYRHEWTTVSAFMLIHLGLGVAVMELGPGGNLVATLVAGAALALLAWRHGWVRLLGLGTAATWGVVSLWMGSRPVTGALSLILGLTLLATLFQVVMLSTPDEEEDTGWIGLAQILNFLGLFGFALRELQPSGHAYLAAGLLGVAHLGVAFAYGRHTRRPLFLLAATEGLMALGFVTPLRLGMNHPHAGFLRLMGLELLFIWGVLLKERYFRTVATLGLAIVSLGLVLFPGAAPLGLRVLLLGTAALLLLADAILVRTVWQEACEAELPQLGWLFSLLGTFLLVVLVILKVPPAAQAAVLAAMALLWVLVAQRSRAGDASLEAGLLAGLSVLAAIARQRPEPGLAVAGSLVALALLQIGHLALRTLPSEDPDWEGPRGLLSHVFSGGAVVLGVLLILQEVRTPWAVPLVGVLALGLVTAGLLLGWREWLVEGLGGLVVAGLALIPALPDAGGRTLHLTHRTWQLGLMAAVSGLLSRILVRLEASWPFGEGGRQVLEGVGEIGAPLLLTILAFLDVPAFWAAPFVMLLGALWLHGASRTWALERQPLRVMIGTGLVLAAFAAVGLRAWGLHGSMWGMPARLVSVLLALALAYLAQQRFDRGPDLKGSFHESLEPASVTGVGALVLVLAGLVLAVLVKSEALARDKNLLVALAYGLAGVISLERSRALQARGGTWRILAHLWMAGGTLHFMAVNLTQPGEIGPVSLRLATAVPMLALLGYVHGTWSEEDGWGRSGYFTGLQALVALVLLYELPRAWVLPAWAFQALGTLYWGLRLRGEDEDGHLAWTRAALVLALATAVRAFGANLVFRDEVAGFRQNLVALPLAVLLLLVGYVLLNRLWREDPEAGRLGAGTHRMPWFILQAVLLFAFIWVECSGTELTVWLSGFGLGMVGLGFLLQERLARQTGLGILTACILKLFIYDLRGLEGLARVASFLVLGLVLIAVSYAYTRFKDRIL